MEVVSGDNLTTGAISRANASNHHHQQTNIQFFTDQIPFLSPNQQCQSTEGKISHSMDLLTPSSPGGLRTLPLTTNSSWLPWGRVAMPLTSPLMPVPQHTRHAERWNPLSCPAPSRGIALYHLFNVGLVTVIIGSTCFICIFVFCLLCRSFLFSSDTDSTWYRNTHIINCINTAEIYNKYHWVEMRIIRWTGGVKLTDKLPSVKWTGNRTKHYSNRNNKNNQNK